MRLKLHFSAVIALLGVGFFSGTLVAQGTTEYVVPMGKVINTTLPDSALRRYQPFQAGSVRYRSGGMGSGLLNYNYLYRAIEFVKDGKDTLLLSKEATIQWAVVVADTFYFQEGWKRHYSNHGRYTLGVQEYLAQKGRRKKDGYGEANSGSVNSLNMLDAFGQPLRNLVSPETIIFGRRSLWFVGNRFGMYRPATKKGVEELMGPLWPAVDRWMRQHKTDLSKPEEIQRMLDYAASLPLR